MHSKRSIWIKTAAGWLISLIFLAPLAIVLLASLKTKPEAASMNLTLPASFQWSNYAEAVRRGNLVRAFLNSALIATVSAVLSLVVSSLAAFVLERRRERVTCSIYNYIFMGLMVPVNHVATIKVFQLLGLMNTYTGIILLNAAMGIPFAVFVYYGFMSSIPRELDEAAMIDGCRPAQLFFRVLFPLLKPVTTTVFVLNFMGAWNDFISPLYLLNASSKWPMVMSVYNFFGLHFNEWNMISAVVILSVLPILVLYIAGQKYIVSGMLSGSVKQ